MLQGLPNVFAKHVKKFRCLYLFGYLKREVVRGEPLLSPNWFSWFGFGLEVHVKAHGRFFTNSWIEERLVQHSCLLSPCTTETRITKISNGQKFWLGSQSMTGIIGV